MQSNRVCLGLLTGQDYPGESHPNNCPCTAFREKEEKDRQKLELRKREEEQKKRETEERRETERVRREKMIEQRKKRFYSQMKSEQFPTPGLIRVDYTKEAKKGQEETPQV